LRFTVRLTPRGGSDDISGWGTGPQGSRVLKARVSAPPEDGKANDALIRLLAAELHVGRSRIQIVSGATSRIKVIEVQGLASLPAAFGDKH
jgi:uncharacterized protein YggU (UPF0235/DUF167 family)